MFMEQFVVPNGEIRRVCNSSQIWARSVLDIDVAYDTDIDLAASVIKEVADDLWKDLETATIIEEPEFGVFKILEPIRFLFA